MKKIKISIIAILAIVLGIAGSAFTSQSTAVKQTKNAIHYIQFTGANNSDTQIETASNWIDLGTNSPALTCAETSGIVCYVKFDGDLSSFQTYVSDKTLQDLIDDQVIQKYRQP